jgi:hypothetical protein
VQVFQVFKEAHHVPLFLLSVIVKVAIQDIVVVVAIVNKPVEKELR